MIELNNAAFLAMLDNTNDMIFIKDADFVYRAASLAFVQMVGKNAVEDIIGKTDLEIFEDPTLAKRYIADDKKLIRSGKNQIDYIEPLADNNGQARYGSTSKYILKDEEGNLLGLLGITKDITRDYFVRQHYQQELKYLFELPKDMYAVSYVDVDNWRIISQRRQNIEEGTLQECHSVEALVEAAIESIVDKECEAARFYRQFTQDFLMQIYTSGKSNMAFKYQRIMSDGAIHWVHNLVRFLTDVDSGHLCVMLSARDIDAEKREEERLHMAAKMDKMTGVLNRETTMESIRKVLREECDGVHALFMLDVDNFKALNDTLGHQAGDEFLIALAKEIKGCFRESDIVGRIGGDEFFALMRGIKDITVAQDKADHLLEVIHKTCAKYEAIHLSASIGIAMYQQNGNSLEELYAKADNALYLAKGAGKNQIMFAE